MGLSTFYLAEICLFSYIISSNGRRGKKWWWGHSMDNKSTFVQTFLANIAADGSKTSIGFKKVHLNGCAEALDDHFYA
jgi:hypothetical protein